MENESKIPRRYFVWMGIALVHLALVSLGAGQRFPKPNNSFLQGLAYYGNLSGADAGYGFFAPSVGSTLKATVEITKVSGEKAHEVLGSAQREVSLRLGNIIGQFWHTNGDKNLQ